MLNIKPVKNAVPLAITLISTTPTYAVLFIPADADVDEINGIKI